MPQNIIFKFKIFSRLRRILLIISVWQVCRLLPTIIVPVLAINMSRQIKISIMSSILCLMCVGFNETHSLQRCFPHSDPCTWTHYQKSCIERRFAARKRPSDHKHATKHSTRCSAPVASISEMFVSRELEIKSYINRCATPSQVKDHPPSSTQSPTSPIPHSHHIWSAANSSIC